MREKLPQLAAQAPLPQPGGGVGQVPGGDAAHFHLVDGGEHHVGDAAASGGAGVDLQVLLAGGHRRGHEDAPAPVVEPPARHAPLPAEHGLRQAGKAVNLHGVGPLGPGQAQHGLLRLEGVLLRHQQHAAPLPGEAVVRQHTADVFCFAAARPAQDKLQHSAAPFPGAYYTTFPWVRKGAPAGGAGGAPSRPRQGRGGSPGRGVPSPGAKGGKAPAAGLARAQPVPELLEELPPA